MTPAARAARGAMRGTVVGWLIAALGVIGTVLVGFIVFIVWCRRVLEDWLGRDPDD